MTLQQKMHCFLLVTKTLPYFNAKNVSNYNHTVARSITCHNNIIMVHEIVYYKYKNTIIGLLCRYDTMVYVWLLRSSISYNIIIAVHSH